MKFFFVLVLGAVQESRMDMLLLHAGRVAFLSQQFAMGCELLAQAPLDPREIIVLYPELQAGHGFLTAP